MAKRNGARRALSPALVIVSHQSLTRRGNRHLSRICDELDAAREFSGVYATNIAVKNGLENLARRIDESRVRAIKVFPYFLHGGFHVGVELPRRLELLRRRHPNLTIELLPHLGTHPRLIQLVRDLAFQV